MDERTVVWTALRKSPKIESEVKTSDEYVADLEAIFGPSIEGAAFKLSFPWDTILEGKNLLAEGPQMQKELRFIKKSVNQTMKEIRTAFRQRGASVEPGILSTLAGKKWAKQVTAKKRLDLRRQQVEELAPYEGITHSIDNALLQLEVQAWLEKNK